MSVQAPNMIYVVQFLPKSSNEKKWARLPTFLKIHGKVVSSNEY